MALEGLTTEQIEAYETELLNKVPESTSIGNMALTHLLGWDDTLYWDIRNRLIERGVLVKGKGKGGSVRRFLVVPAAVPGTTQGDAVVAHARDEEEARESDLYEPMAEVLRNRWAQDSRLDEVLVEITAAQGSRQTKGKWTRPDITVASYNTYTYVPGRHFDVVTF